MRFPLMQVRHWKNLAVARGCCGRRFATTAVDIHLDDFGTQGTLQQALAVSSPLAVPVEDQPRAESPVPRRASGHADFAHSTISSLRS